MYEDLESFQTKGEEENEEDSDSSSYSFPSYTRFTFTGKTKSRLGRHNRFNRQTANKTALTKEDGTNVNPGTNENIGEQMFQAPKTPNMNWLRSSESVTHPVTPGRNDSGIDLSSQSNFLSFLKNDSTCKRSLGFSNTPFKHKENQPTSLKELNQLFQKTSLPSINLVCKPKEENKENRTSDSLQDPWNKLKQICDSTASKISKAPTLNSAVTNSIPLGDKISDSHNNKLERNSNQYNKTFGNTLSSQKSHEEEVFSTPLDLSTGENLTGNKNTVIKNAFGDSNLLSANIVLATNSVKERSDNITKDMDKLGFTDSFKESSDTFNSILPTFLVPTNKTNAYDPSQTKSKHSPPSISTANTKQSPPLEIKPIPTGTQNTALKPVSSNVAFKQPYSYLGHVDNRGFDRNVPSKIPQTINMASSREHIPSTVFGLNHKPNSPPEVKLGPQKTQETPSKSSVYECAPKRLSPPVEQFKENKSVHENNQNNFSLTNKQSLESQVQSSSNSSTRTSKLESIVAVTKSTNQLVEDTVLKSLSSSSNNQVKCDGLLGLKTPLASHNSVLIDNSLPKPLANSMQPTLNNDLVSKQESFPLQSKFVSAKEGINIKIETQSSEVKCEKAYETQPKENIKCPDTLKHMNVCSTSEKQQQSTPMLPVYQQVFKKSPEVVNNPAPVQQNIHQQAASVSDPGRQRTYLAPIQPVEQRLAQNFPHSKPEIPAVVNRPQNQNCFKAPAPRGLMSRANTELYVNGKAYTILSMLGRGGSSEVFQVIEPRSAKLLAVKCVDLSMVDKTIADGYLNEIDLLSKLQGCASVIRMFDYEYVQEQKMLYVVMEKGDTDLSHLIRDITKTEKISMSMIIYYWTEMLNAVKNIHDQGIIHSDLKPANFLLVSGRLKLIDFGIASAQGDMTSVVKEVTTGTWNYMSPEALQNTSATGKGFKITYKSDVWSLGCILYNLVYGKTPFAHITNTWAKLQAIIDTNHQIVFPDVGAPTILTHALRCCLRRVPTQRPTVAELLNLPYHTSHTQLATQIHSLLPDDAWNKIKHLFAEVELAQDSRHADVTKA